MRFADELQSQFDQFLNDLESAVLQSDTYTPQSSPKLQCQFESLMSSSQEKATSSRTLRLAQSILNQLGTSITCTINEPKIQNIVLALLSHLESINQTLYSSQLTELIDLTHYYTQCGDIIKRRNCAIIASICCANSDAQNRLVLFQNLGPFLIRCLLESTDAQTKLFAIIALENLATERAILSTLRNNNRLREALNELLSEQCTLDIDLKLFQEDFDYLTFQTSFCACLFLEQLLHDSLSDPRKAKQLKRFNSNRSLRSDFGWNDIHMDEFLITSGVYFYEVLLLTDGQMFFGWSTVSSSACCHGKIASISYDGYNRVILHGQEKVSVQEANPTIKRWRAGDVIGCLIDLGPRSRVVFYVNGDPVEFAFERSNVGSSYQQYFPSAKLSMYQQCYCNYGEVPFKNPPRDVEYKNFNSNNVYVPTMCSIQ